MPFFKFSNCEDFFQVDECDTQVARGHSWSKHYKGYVVCRINRKNTRLHRLIAGVEGSQDIFIDHIDGNPANNTRKNLRIATRSQNAKNRKISKKNKFGFKGVKQRRASWGFEAIITSNKVVKRLGTYKTPEEAARAYDRAAKELHGEFARLNFPNEAA